MRIFGSISELVDLAFRLAGGKQVKLKSSPQTTSGTLVTVNVPDVAATGDTQNMILTAATQSMTNKTLGAGTTITAGTINGAVVGGSIPAAGTFTDIVGSTLDINTSAELQTLTIPSFATAGILHNNSSGNVSTSLIVNADVDAAAALAFSKLASLSSGNILVGSNTGVPTSRAVTGDVTIDNLGATTIGSTKVLNSMLAGSIDRSKLLAGTTYRILANSSTGVMSENAALTANEAVATDANGQLTSVTGVSATELGYLSGVTSDVQSQINSKQASDATLTAIAGVTTAADKYVYFDGVDTAQASTITSFGRSLVDDADAATARSTLGLGTISTQAASNVAITGGSVTGITDLAIADGGTGASTAGAALTNLGAAATAGKLSQFASTTSAELAGVISDETGTGALVFASSPSLTSPVIVTDLRYSNQAAVKFYEQTGNGTNYIGLSAPDAVTTDATFKLPNGDGTIGQVLSTDGAKNLGWTSPLTNPMTAVGDVIVGGASGTATRLAPNTIASKRYLTQTGTGSAGQTPVWSARTIPTQQIFSSGSGTYTTPAGVLYIRLRMVGGGGGGSGSGTSNSGGTGGAGTNSTFSTCTAGGASAGAAQYLTGTPGGASLGAGWVGLQTTGSYGGAPGSGATATIFLQGGNGGCSPASGAGGGGIVGAGTAAASASGSGGGGAGASNITGSTAGAGGSAGGYIDVILTTTPAATYSYSVGVGGSAGAAGTSGFAGGAGGSGFIVIEEHYI